MSGAIYRRVWLLGPGILLLFANVGLAESVDVTLRRITENQPFIAAAAEKFRVDARTLSAIFFTERTLNYDWTDETLDEVLFSDWHQNSSIGFGQVKAKTAYFIERQFVDSTNVFYPGTEFADLLTVSRTKEELLHRLLSDSSNICYAAAYMRLMSSRWTRAGFPIQSAPEILGTLYSTGLFYADGSERVPRPTPEANRFGRKVEEAMVLFKIDGSVDMNAYKSLVAEVRFRRLLKYLILGPGFILLLPLLVILTMRWVNPSKSSYMLQQSAAGHQIQSKWTSLDEISPYAVLAVLAAEDIHFPQHQGFDFGQIKRAFRYNQIHKTSLGASTISQQVAKNLFLWHGKSYLRKGLEVYLTVLIELLWSKRRILEVYLNIAEMGPDLFGIGVASEHFFAKPPSALTPDDAASLAVVLPNPRLYAVSHPSAAVAERRDKVLQTVYYLESIKYLKNF